jgi:hypothetical protein
MEEIPDDKKEAIERQEWFDSQAIPPQCRRRVYMSGDGILRSVVICESLGNQRVYHDK